MLKREVDVRPPVPGGAVWRTLLLVSLIVTGVGLASSLVRRLEAADRVQCEYRTPDGMLPVTEWIDRRVR